MKKNSMRNIKTINKAISLLQLFLLLIAFAMMFLPAIRGINDINSTYTGLDIVFGKQVTSTVFFIEMTYTVFEFSILNLIPYIIILFAIIVLTLSIISHTRNMLMDAVLCLLMVVAGVLMLNVVRFTVPGKDIQEFLSLFGAEFKLSNYFEIAIGAIISSVVLFLSALLSLSKIIVISK